MTTRTILIGFALGAMLVARDAPPPDSEDVPPAPLVALAGSVNGRVEVTVYRGWPLFVDASLFLEEGEKARLALKEGAWTAALKLSFVSTANAEDIAERFTLLPVGADQEEIAALEQVVAAWQLSGNETSALETGDYEVRIAFDSTGNAADEAYEGSAKTRMLVVHVEDPPEELSEELHAEKALLEARFEEEKDDPGRALEILDELLTRQPKSLAVLEARADLLARMERLDEALAGYDATIAALREKLAGEETKPTHPPSLLIRKKNAILARQIEAEQAAAKAPGVR